LASGIDRKREGLAHSERGGKGEAILQAALELFAERGFDGTPIPMVAERAGVSPGTIYVYFASKEALVNALFQRCYSLFHDAMFEGFSLEAPPREQLHIIWQRRAELTRKHPVAAAFIELHHHSPYLDEASRALIQAAVRTGKEYVARNIERKLMKSLPPEVLMAIVDGIFVGIMKASRQGQFEVTQEIIDAAEESCWEAIRLR
jgi:TetR/AcrR family transcriptional regulator, repressor of fatR-cypB operon